ncbi:hypothetical protein [Streptomyces sp. NPDC005805]|uniref:hypothetical protein n=1 Tax=Streptomyces sp. NPDC005805 TaxID=3157068 RepID=UPI0033FAC597
MDARAAGAGAGWLLAAAPLLTAGGLVTATGTGAPGLTTQTFTRIDCREARTMKGGTVWHCAGESPDQVRINDKTRQDALRDAVRAHVDGTRPPRPVPGGGRTDLLFVDHDGREDPDEVTATLSPAGGRWIAHAPGVVGTGVALLLAGAAAAGWGTHRLRAAREPRHR